MTFIDTVPEGEAAGRLAEQYEATRAAYGYLPNLVQAFSLRPEVFDAWQHLVNTVKAGADLRRYELATMAAARRLRSSYCMLAHGKVLVDEHLDAGTVRDLAVDHRAAGLDAADVAVMDFAEKVVDDAVSVTQADVDRLRDLGLSDTEIFDVVLAATIRCFFSKTLDAVGAQPDSALAELDPDLRDALVVGRPISP
jgi:uncharacterized peroxidase-related enzyme